MSNKLEFYKGNTSDISIAVKDANGDPFDLTDFTMTLIVKESSSEEDVEAEIEKEAVISAPTTGVGIVSLTATDTNIDAKIYCYEIQINKSTDDIKTLFVDDFEIRQSIKRITP